MAKAVDTIINETVMLVSPLLDDMGLELVDVEYLTERGRWILRIYIDKPGGVTIDDCVEASNEVGALLDVKDIIPVHYVLEVSSPGLDRPLKKEKDFLRFVGEKIKVRMKHDVYGRKNFTGVFRRYERGILYVEVDGNIFSLPRADIAKANLVYSFDS